MPATSIKVLTNGQRLVVNSLVSPDTATAVPVFSDAAMTQPVTLPINVPADTVFFLSDAWSTALQMAVSQADGTVLGPYTVRPLINSHVIVAPRATNLQDQDDLSGLYLTINEAPLSLSRFLARGTGVNADAATNDAALAAAMTAAGGTTSDPSGTVITVPAGDYRMSATSTVPTKTILRGLGRGGVQFKAAPNFPTSSAMFNLGGANIAFGTRLEDMQLDCSDIAGTTGVYSNRINEQAGLQRVLVKNFQAYGVQIQNSGANQAQNFVLTDLELYASASAPGTVVGLGITLNGAACYGADRITFAVSGSGQISGATAVMLDGVGGLFSRLHVEGATTGVLVGSLQATAGLAVSGVTGRTTAGMTDLVKLSNNFGSQNVALFALQKNGATNAVTDQLTGNTSTASQVGFYVIGNGSGAQIPVWTDDRNITSRFGSGLTVNGGPLTLNNVFAHTGLTFGTFGVTPSAQRATTASATDLASVITLANALRADLQAYGLKQ
jgi:hypothetical protein